jgi:NDP-sugar pyrophosphorylase family protein
MSPASLPCVILAGGRGTRMRPFTDEMPKALIPVNGRPFAHLQLELLASQGVTEVVYSIGYRGDLIREAVGDGGAFGVRVTYVDEGSELRGTGGAVRLCLDAGALPPAFMVLYGDSYLPIALAPVAAAFAASGKPALMTVLRNEGRWDRSNVIFEGGRLELYDKRLQDPRMLYIDYGLTVLTREVVGRLPAAQVSDLADFYRELTLTGQMAGFEVTQRFYEVGSPEGLSDLEHRLAKDPA